MEIDMDLEREACCTCPAACSLHPTRGVIDVDALEGVAMDEQKVLCTKREELWDGTVKCTFVTVEKALNVPQIDCTVSLKGDLPWKANNTYGLKISL